jgi:lipopolysaccharide export system permease protein
MINLQFFPSRRLALYLAKLFVSRSLAVLLALVGILMMLDLLGNSGKILAVPGNGDAEVWRYVFLRLPQLISRFLPFSVLLGTLIAFAGLNQHSEIISMKAAGMSAHQIIAPLVLTAALIGLVHFAFAERVVTRATAALSAWDAVDYGPVPPSSNVRNNIAIVHGDDLVFVRVVAGEGAAAQLAGINIYDRAGGTLQRTIAADRARYVPGAGWRLENVALFDLDSGRLQRMGTMDFGRGIDPTQFTLAGVDPDAQDFLRLRHSIAELRAADRPTEALSANLWHKLAGPASTLLMPLLAAVAAFGLARSGQVLVRAAIGMALGFTYFVADNFSLAMGNAGAYPPLVAAWAPFVLFLLIGEAVLVRTEE